MTLSTLATARFEAARRLPASPDPRSQGLHGHGFRVCASSPQPGLAEALAAAVAPLDYTDLNTRFARPDDRTLAEALLRALPQGSRVALFGAPEHGVELDATEALVSYRTEFEAAHCLPHVPPGHKCGRLHGHGFGIRLVADADRHASADLVAAWAPLFLQLNHRYLNDLPGLDNPTSEVMARWLHAALLPRLPGLRWVEVHETRTAGSLFDGERFLIWKEQRFESATPLDTEGRYTGHSYLVRLMLAGSLDETMGWLLDFGDVKDRFKPLYRQLDHNPLDTLPGIRSGSTGDVAGWIAGRLAPQLPELARVDLMTSARDGVSLCLAHGRPWPLL